ncbi:MAG: hypothetical protein IKP40_01995 [Clostridia bacterium]|nr:hypothetical protein [Clostridia bacterium]
MMKKTTALLLILVLLFLVTCAQASGIRRYAASLKDGSLIDRIMTDIEGNAEAERLAAEGHLITVRMTSDSDVYTGDHVTLQAEIPEKAAGEIRWERLSGYSKSTGEPVWRQVGTGSSFTLTAPEEEGSFYFRAVLVTADGAEHISDMHAIDVMAKLGGTEEQTEITNNHTEVLKPEPVAEPETEIEDLFSQIEELIPDEVNMISEPTVYITSNRGEVMRLGETITMTAVTEGFEGENLTYQWECDKGSGYEPVEGATGISHSFPASVDSLSWNWRLTVTSEKAGE